MSKKMLELFAGSCEVSSAARLMGFEVFAVDIQPFPKVDLVKDINKLNLGDVPFVPDVIWASFDCTTYSIAAISKHRHSQT